jgi:two-component system, OmpR family, sensor kinase
MRRRLTVSLIAIAVTTLALTLVGSVLLIHRSTTSSAETELLAQTQAAVRVLKEPLVGSTTTSLPAAPRRERAQVRRRAAARRVLARDLKRIGTYQDLVLTSVHPDGSVTPAPPAPLTVSDLQPTDLQAGRSVSGAVDEIVFAAVPYGPVPSGTGVVVGTRAVHNPLSGLGYFLVVAAVVLALATVVALYLARRITRPLLGAVATTRRIAGGDLDARVPVGANDYPELRELAVAINRMGDRLASARGLERQFLLSISHELRTPLTSIRGYADALAEGATDDVAGAVHVIEAEALRLDRLIQDLLDLARLDARQFSLHPSTVDVSEIGRSASQGFVPEATTLGLTLEGPPEASSAVLAHADPDRLQQIAANLLENALKYASTIVVVDVEIEANGASLRVTDDGPGISPDEIPRVFERHFRSDRWPGRRVGTGLGLAIVAELAAAMGGSVEVHSPVEQGRGTSMVVHLPAAGVGALSSVVSTPEGFGPPVRKDR